MNFHIAINRRHEQAGTATIEMALVLPLLLMLVLGILDFGRALNYWNDANQIAADGARFAAVNRNPGLDNGQTLQQWLEAQADTGEFAGTSPTVNVSAANAIDVCVQFIDADGDGLNQEVGDAVKVNVSGEFQLLPLTDTNGPGSVKLNGSATMRLEQVPTNFVADCVT